MDKIQKMHGSVHWNTTEQECKAHATITEDLMGRFAEWVEREGFKKTIGDAYIKIGFTHRYYMSELIQLFKETL